MREGEDVKLFNTAVVGSTTKELCTVVGEQESDSGAPCITLGNRPTPFLVELLYKHSCRRGIRIVVHGPDQPAIFPRKTLAGSVEALLG